MAINKPTLHENINEVFEYNPEIGIVLITSMSEIGKGAFVWYQNDTIIATIKEHKKKYGWIPAKIYVDDSGHYIKVNENRLENKDG